MSSSPEAGQFRVGQTLPPTPPISYQINRFYLFHAAGPLQPRALPLLRARSSVVTTSRHTACSYHWSVLHIDKVNVLKMQILHPLATTGDRDVGSDACGYTSHLDCDRFSSHLQHFAFAQLLPTQSGHPSLLCEPLSVS